MSSAFRCDRCGDYFSDKPECFEGSLIVRKRKFLELWATMGTIEWRKELCPSCAKRLMEYIEGDAE